MKIVIAGAGYVGLVTAAGLAEHGNHVECVDVDQGRIERLRCGDLPFREPGLYEMVRHNMDAGRLRFSTDNCASAGADAAFICVGTPSAADGSCDASGVFHAARALLDGAVSFLTIVVKSTVPVGTCDALAKLESRYPFAVASCPEFLAEGQAVENFLRPDRVVVGASDPRARDLLRALYQPIVRTGDRLLLMDARSAEAAKYAVNGMLAARISYMNEIALWCEQTGADVDAVRQAVGSDSRVGQRFLYAGIGYGGSCFPKDARAACADARSRGAPLGVLERVQEANERAREAFVDKVLAVRPRVVACWGLTFKPETDDCRESPARAVARALAVAGIDVRAHDPALADRDVLEGRQSVCADAYEAARGADALCLLTEWREYRHPDFARLAEVMRGRHLFDGRNAWDAGAARAAGFEYKGVGRP